VSLAPSGAFSQLPAWGWERDKKWFTQMRSVNHFTPCECYFILFFSIKNIFKLTNISLHTKHSKIRKTFYAKTNMTLVTEIFIVKNRQ